MSDPPSPAGPIAILVRDLMFSSKIIAEAKAAGRAYIMIRDPAKLPTLDPATCFLIVDLNLPGAIDAARLWRENSHKPVIGFVSHVDTPTIAAARQAAIDQVLPRSRFVQFLPTLIRNQER